MQAGNLLDRVGFYQRPSTSDAYGNVQAEFGSSADFTIAANIKPKLGGEQIQAARLAGTNMVNITVRQCALTDAVTPEWRIKNERTGELFNIRNIIDPFQGDAGNSTWWEMLCEKGVAG